MGYTHYWRPQADIPTDAWEKIRQDTAKLIAASPVKLAYEEGDKNPPVISNDMIRFNAFDEPEAHETFLLNRCKKDDFEFCKTAAKRYDDVVCGVLAVVQEHARMVIRISSDGGQKDWHDALAWASEVLGRPIKISLRGDDEEDA